MILFLLGILLFVFAKSIVTLFPYRPQLLSLVRYGGLILAIIGISNASVKQIEAGQVGVQTLFGKTQDRILESGLNVVNPFVEVSEMDIKTQNYTMSSVATEGDKTGDDAIRVLSADGLEVVIE